MVEAEKKNKKRKADLIAPPSTPSHRHRPHHTAVDPITLREPMGLTTPPSSPLPMRDEAEPDLERELAMDRWCSPPST